jgi:hypothetical protein
MHGQSFVDGVDELAHGLDRGPLTFLNGLENLFGQLRRLFDLGRGPAGDRTALPWRRRLCRRATLGRGLSHGSAPFRTWIRSLVGKPGTGPRHP